MTFDEAFARLLGHEGGYSNRRLSDDPGGKTMYGITEATARANGYTGAMQDMSQDVAKAIYHTQYWTPLKIDSLPAGLRYSVFDASVNSGPRQAAKWLQRAVGADDDGVIGPRTLAAASAMPTGIAVSRLNGHRLMLMATLTNWPGNSRGWAKRIASNLLET